MSRRVLLTDTAALHLGNIRQWFEQPGAGGSARNVLSALVDGIAGLGEFPFMGREGDVPGTREQIVRRHRVIYRVPDDDVMIVAVLGPGQDHQSPGS
jgi:plasmid stabilization system protein ParE